MSEMEFDTADLKLLFQALSERMKSERDGLCALDGAIGDADHGIAMEEGMAAAALTVANLPDATLQDLFNAAAKAFLNAVGGSTGPLYATAFLRAGKSAGPRTSMPRSALADILAAMTDGIAQRGKTETGQKTMLDAWMPAARAASAGGSLADIVAAANEGAQSTKAMIATLGRAARLGERSLGHPDPGAVSAAMIIEEFARAFA